MNMEAAVNRRPAAGRVALAALVAAILAGPAVALGGSLDRQVTRGNGVEVSVTPGPLAPGAEVWEFEVTFNTHSGALDGDPAASSVLVDGQGNRHAALEWQGSPPGGHHRNGVLRFRPLSPPVEIIELRVGGVGEIDVRTFRWEP